MDVPLSAAAIATVKATIPTLHEHGLAITTRLYKRLREDAEMAELFRGTDTGAGGHQPRALAAAVLAYAQNIDNLADLAGAVETIAQSHVERRIEPRHYTLVAAALIGAIEDVLGDAATADILAAWTQAYWRLAHILQAAEAQLYAARRRSAAA
jgi:nitric oxide dioxygenase